MSDLRIVRAVSSVTRGTADDEWMAARGTRDGAIFSADWLTGLALEGRCFGCNVGTASTPVTFGATYTAAMQDLYIYVPAGTVVIPVYISIAFEDSGTALISDVFAAASSNGDSAVGGTAITAYNMRMDAPHATGCTVTQVIGSLGTTHLGGNRIEFWRPFAGFTEDAFALTTAWANPRVHGCEWKYTDSLVPPIITGGGALSVFASTGTGIGWIIAIWAELPSNSIV